MFHWVTDTIVADMKALPGVSKAEATQQGGSYDTCQVVVHVDGTDEECLFVYGFPSTEEECTTPDDAQCEWVVLSDGMDSRGGLNSDHPETTRLYSAIKRYLRSRGAEVIRHEDEIF